MSSHYASEKVSVPFIGQKVVIFVDSVNSPTGTWEGKVVKLHEEKIGDEVHYQPDAIITDTRAPAEYIARIPHLNYKIVPAEEAISRLLAKLDEQKREINGLKSHHKIECGVYERIIKSLVKEQGLKSFEDVVAQLKKIVDKLSAKA